MTVGRSIKAFEEHNKCAWSVDFCHSNPLRLASGSDDFSVKLWSMNQVLQIIASIITWNVLEQMLQILACTSILSCRYSIGECRVLVSEQSR